MAPPRLGLDPLRYAPANASCLRLRLVNHVDVEQYLRGMGEVRDPGWPASALRAQAIAARTYALRAMAGGGQLCDTQQCQVYLGAQAEYGAMDKAVTATRGQVVGTQLVEFALLSAAVLAPHARSEPATGVGVGMTNLRRTWPGGPGGREVSEIALRTVAPQVRFRLGREHWAVTAFARRRFEFAPRATAARTFTTDHATLRMERSWSAVSSLELDGTYSRARDPLDLDERVLAPVGEVTTPIRRGRNGNGRLRAWSNRPSAASRALSCSKASWSAPTPFGSAYSTIT